MASLSYDKENDILYLSEGLVVKESIDIGDFIFDLDSESRIIGLEVLNASDHLQDHDLASLRSLKMKVKYGQKSCTVTLFLGTKDILIPLELEHRSFETRVSEFAVA